MFFIGIAWWQIEKNDELIRIRKKEKVQELKKEYRRELTIGLEGRKKHKENPMQKRYCPHCGRGLRPEVNICPFCSKKNMIYCIECGRKIKSDFDVCPFCGGKNNEK